MTLTLTLADMDSLENGQPVELALDRHGAMIGRSPHADWSLPDPRSLISSRHCKIGFEDGHYVLSDHSTNGTYLNGATERLRGDHRLRDGDRIAIGHYTLVVRRDDGAAAPPVAATPEHWADFPASDRHEPDSAAQGWAEPPAPRDDHRAAWRSAAPTPAPARSAGTWDLPAPVAQPSAWSSAPRTTTAPTAEDVWGQLSSKSEIDWSRGNFAALAPSGDDWRPLDRPTETQELTQDGPEPVTEGAPAAAIPKVTAPMATEGWAGFVAQSGLPADRLSRAPAEAIAAAGAILRQMVGGLMLMIEARARAKAQLGVQATGLELDGNNILKFVRSPERALLQLLDRPEPGFMPAERAVEDAFQDLQAHQMATLTAMRGALKGTLARFAPATIRDRVTSPDRLARWFPALRRARQWDAYEREFEGVVAGADDAFMDLFAKEFRLHYDRNIAEMKARGRKPPE